jgi:3-methyladenine DNA glycosylase Mpg/broad specificity phosphatase PhoE
MTTVYFIRHAEADKQIYDGRIRPLTQKGLCDRRLVTDFLQNQSIDAVLSSPFKRAVDTVAEFAEKNNLAIELVENFREQKTHSDWNRKNDIKEHLKRQWADFSYKLGDGESLQKVQDRNIAALQSVLTRYKDKNIVIGTHGTALSTVINYYDESYGFENFIAMSSVMPWAVRMDFDENRYIRMEKIDLFHGYKLTKEFYGQRADILAPLLLGKIVVRKTHNGDVLRSRITETECYLGESDTACHTHKGKTARTEVLYRAGGVAYVYLCYGMHSLFNVVSGRENHPEAVLIRGVQGTSGPGRVTKMLNIDRGLNAVDLCGGTLWLEDDGFCPEYTAHKRVGIDYASEEDRDRLWRFITKG